jgi:hypothetical protein
VRKKGVEEEKEQFEPLSSDKFFNCVFLPYAPAL